MNPFRPILYGIHAAKVAGALYDLGIDVKRLDRVTAANLYKVEKASYGMISAHVAALVFFLENLRTMPSEARLLDMPRIDTLERAAVLVAAWGNAGKLESSRVQGCVDLVRAEMAS